MHPDRTCGIRMGAIAACGGLVVGAVLAAGTAHAQAYPTKPIRLLVGYSPGGPTDIIARITGLKLAEALGQQVVIDNRAGAGGTVALDIGAKSNPDGHTLMLGANGEVSISPSLYAKLPFNVERDLAPIIQLANSALLLVVYPGLPANSVKELVALARAKPGTINAASSGAGSTAHLCLELLRMTAKIDLVHIPYKGAGPALTDVVGGHAHLMITGISGTLPHVRAGRLKPLGVTSEKRQSGLPDIPAIAEQLPGYEVLSWYGLFAPAATPRAVTARIHTEASRLLQTADMKERLAQQGFEPAGGDSEVFRTFIRRELDKWAKVIKTAGIKVE
jgi:tripartite-type tricarboxylate transporter receptor subunit TctC